MQVDTHYFDIASPEHTEKVLSLVKQFLNDNPDIEHIVVATTEGATGIAAAKEFPDKKVVVVTHQTGFAKENENELSEEKREYIESLGAHVHTATHAFAGVARSFRKVLNTWMPTEIVAVGLKTFGQGTKVCAEIAMMAADAGLAPVDRDVVCIGGTGRGADTAWVVRPANSHAFPRLRMKACICKPLGF
ncbi:MAG: pyruvate kinase alpha/beta domain-containing protein [Candidatus Thorarchaeota archaeon]